MSLIVDEKNELREMRNQHPASLRWPAQLISIILHPLFIPVYVHWFMLRANPWLFPFDDWNKTLLLIQVFVLYTLLPAVAVLLMKALGFISGLTLKTQRDRVIPYIACGIFYFWGWYVARNLDGYPTDLVAFRLAIFIAASAALLANIYFKISMHAIAMGVVCAHLIGFSYQHGTSMSVYISICVFLTGLVCTARFLVSDHTQKEIYGGVLLGVLSQVIALQF